MTQNRPIRGKVALNLIKKLQKSNINPKQYLNTSYPDSIYLYPTYSEAIK